MNKLKILRNLNIFLTFSFLELIFLSDSNHLFMSIVSVPAFILYMFISLDVDNDMHKQRQ